MMLKHIVAFLIVLTMTAQAEKLEGVITYGGADVPLTVFLPENYTRGQTLPLMITLAPGPWNADMAGPRLRCAGRCALRLVGQESLTYEPHSKR